MMRNDGLDPVTIVVEVCKEPGLLIMVPKLMKNVNLLFLSRCISDLPSKKASGLYHGARIDNRL
jgi:hypothetical protein